MELVNAPAATLKGKCITCVEASISLAPCATSLKVLSSLCLFGKVVAPMLVDADDIIEFVTKNWQKKVTVCLLAEGPVSKNCFKLGFASGEDRDWALENAPWSFKGYTFALHSWFSGIEHSQSVDILRVWVQFHNLPHEYFSIENGTLLGGKKWIQCKYEKIGIFCYFCGRLGHQRRGCSLSSPVMVEAVDGATYPMFGPWLSTVSRFHDVFSGAASQAGVVVHGRPLPDNALEGTVARPVATSSRASNRGKKRTGRALSDHHRGTIQTWVPKVLHAGRVSRFAENGNRVGVILNEDGKSSGPFPNILSSSQEGQVNNLLVSSDKVCGGAPLVSGANKTNCELGQGSRGPGGLKEMSSGLGLINIECVGGNGELNVSRGSNCLNPSGPHLALEPPMNNGLKLNEFSSDKLEPNGVGGLGHLEFGGINLSPPRGNFQDNIGGPQLVNSKGKEAENDVEEKKALSHFFKAQEESLYDLKHFGKLDLYEIKQLGGYIGVPLSSETNERTTPFKKRKFEGSASLCSRPHKLVRTYHGVVRDFPWDTKRKIHEARAVGDDLSEEPSEEPSEEKEEKVRIYAGGLGESVTADELSRLFQLTGGVVDSVDFVRTKGRSLAYVDFLPSSPKSLSNLFAKYNGCA
ncbi:hypothetical protein G4B88_005482 [Cannabis sativa]|uniref:CCHC-type domain-containing protein n=1 Tax=Cannabis sativa TaxID=3483 RepID=A0A7J6HB56_CANSA|nr:hypothetical protein G4B88_005482 [Cannabis sativa]